MIDAGILDKLSVITDEERAILAGSSTVNWELYTDASDGSKDIITGDKLLAEGKTIDIRPHTRFMAFPEHSHDYVEMIYMCRGTTRHCINGDKITLHEGELLILGQNARQSIEVADTNDIAVNFIVRPEFFSGVLPYLGEKETPLSAFILNCLYGKNEARYLYYRVSHVIPVQNLMENLVYTLMEEVPPRRGIQQMTMGLLFLELLRHTDALAFLSADQGVLMQVLRYIEDHYKDGSLTDLARSIPYETTALSRLIKHKTGKTYTELLQEKRLSQAAWLLHNTNASIDEIARRVGYQNMTYFHRLFFERFGTTPKKYRINVA